MVERFSGRIEDVPQSHCFRPGEDLEQIILRYVRLYNGQLPQSVLMGRTPIDALRDWHRDKPEQFKKRPYNHTACDTYQNRPEVEGFSGVPEIPSKVCSFPHRSADRCGLRKTGATQTRVFASSPAR